MIATLEAPSDAPNLADQFIDLTQWLEPGVEYDHMILKGIFYEVGNLGLNAREGDPAFRIGGRFFYAIYHWWEAGYIEMTESESNGQPCDFWTAVFMAKHHENKHFKVVEGYLKIVAVPESAAEVIPW